jgi:hypothetical protein
MINLPKFSRFVLEAGGEGAGTNEVANTSLEDARNIINSNLSVIGKSIKDIKDFSDNFKKLQKSVHHGIAQRRDMPVVSSKQVKYLRDELIAGNIDILKPYNLKYIDYTLNHADLNNAGKSVKDLYRVSGKFDGDEDDDKIKAEFIMVKAQKIIPIQKQIYLSKFSSNIIKYGLINKDSKMLEKPLIISKDYELIDGHHRWMSIMICNPNLEVKVLRIHLEAEKLLNVVKNFGISMGNKQND